MEIWHHLAFSRKDNVDATIESLKLKHKKTPSPGGGYIISFDVSESHPDWPQIEMIVQEKQAVDMYDTLFTDSEVLSAEWSRLLVTFEHGYPQPENGWEKFTYENDCPRCGAGFLQKAPFHLVKEPRMGEKDFLCLFWAYEVFCTPRVLNALEINGILGYKVWPAIIHRTNEPSKVVSQLIATHIAEPALGDKDKLEPKTCPLCGTTKYAYHKRGYMCLKHERLQTNVDCQVTSEWFGSGGYGFQEIIVWRRFAKLILDNGWHGVRLKPIELV